jgi:hypothetical protein
MPRASWGSESRRFDESDACNGAGPFLGFLQWKGALYFPIMMFIMRQTSKG